MQVANSVIDPFVCLTLRLVYEDDNCPPLSSYQMSDFVGKKMFSFDILKQISKHCLKCSARVLWFYVDIDIFIIISRVP